MHHDQAMKIMLDINTRFSKRRHQLAQFLAFATLAVGSTMGLNATSAEALTFNLNPTFDITTTQGAQAYAGFQKAANLWSGLLQDDVEVSLDIGFESLAPNVLGQASSNTVGVLYGDVYTALDNDILSNDDRTAFANLQIGPSLDFLTTDLDTGETVRNNDVSGKNLANNSKLRIHRANAKALGLLGAADNSVADGLITFSSDFGFDFDPDDGISAGLFDFVGVAAHEIGHALGFASGVDIVDYFALPNGPQASMDIDLGEYPIFSVLDLYRYSAESAALGILDLAAGSPAYFSLDGGTTAIAPFSTGAFNGNGDQASHWMDHLGLGLLDPKINPGELLEFTANDILAFDVLGWDLNSQMSPPNPSYEPPLLDDPGSSDGPEFPESPSGEDSNPTSVPEPGTVLGLVMLAGGWLLKRKTDRRS